MNISLSPFAPENLVSRDGFSSPVLRQPAHLHTQAESSAYLVLITGFLPSSAAASTQFRTDGLHCRESAAKVVPNRCCLVQVTMDQLICASPSHTHYWYGVWSGYVEGTGGMWPTNLRMRVVERIGEYLHTARPENCCRSSRVGFARVV